MTGAPHVSPDVRVDQCVGPSTHRPYFGINTKSPSRAIAGGERTLTSAALLFAILTVNPSPFCILDEVDAALDESNVGRFREALAELTRTTQFILITHNRGTIEAADTLYGVTMGDEGASKVLSLQLADLIDS